MNKKANSLIGTIPVLVGVVVLLLFIMIISVRVADKKTQMYAAGSCESGDLVEGASCMDEALVCKTNTKKVNAAKMLGGCPSDRFMDIAREHYDGAPNAKVMLKQYNQCCQVDSCSDISDQVFGKSVERSAVCFDDAACVRSDSIYAGVSGEFKNCVGHALDCLQDEGCCCVLGDK